MNLILIVIYLRIKFLNPLIMYYIFQLTNHFIYLIVQLDLNQIILFILIWIVNIIQFIYLMLLIITSQVLFQIVLLNRLIIERSLNPFNLILLIIFSKIHSHTLFFIPPKIYYFIYLFQNIYPIIVSLIFHQILIRVLFPFNYIKV